MEGLSNYRSKLEAIEALILKLENGELSVSELSDLADLTAELHERSIILKYKAFEMKSSVSIESPAAVEETKEEPTIVIEEPVIEAESVQQEEAPSLDFSLFEKPEIAEAPEMVFETPEVETPTIEVSTPDVVEEVIEKIVVPEAPVIEPVQIVEEPKIETPVVPSSGRSFMDQIKTSDDGIGGQFNAKLDSLIGAFGLNQRLRYINDLFDGSSDAFGDAIKSLDNQQGIEAVRPKIDVLASENQWDPEEEAVAEFVTMIKRRYA